MYKMSNFGLSTPTANLAINKSRIKSYGKNLEVPTYYLQKGQEFQIELFNPTKDNIMAKISLNGKPIAQGGLVLKPGQRVFLDRYIDVAKKFLFDTYEVENSSEARKAIEDNGDFRVEFHREKTITTNNWVDLTATLGRYSANIGVNDTDGVKVDTNFKRPNIGDDLSFFDTLSDKVSDIKGEVTSNITDLSNDLKSIKSAGDLKKGYRKLKKTISKTVETGRVEKGSDSDQSLTMVYMDWEHTPFHIVEYKMLPLSQKINNVSDISVKRYCTSCGTKQKPSFKFCPSCGVRA